MKKLIATLGIIGLIASTSTTVVSCSLINNTKLGLEKKVNELAAVTAAALRPAIAQSVTNRSSKDLWTHLSHLKASDAISGINANDERSVSDILTNESQFYNMANISTLNNGELDPDHETNPILVEGSKRTADPTFKTISNLSEMVLNLFASQGGFNTSLASTIAPAIEKLSDVLGLGSAPMYTAAEIKNPIKPNEKITLELKIKNIVSTILNKALISLWSDEGVITVAKNDFYSVVGDENGKIIWVALGLALGTEDGQKLINGFLPKWVKISKTVISPLKITFNFGFKIPSIKELVSSLRNNEYDFEELINKYVNKDSLDFINNYLHEHLNFNKDKFITWPPIKNLGTRNNISNKSENKHFTNGLINLLEFMFKPLPEGESIIVESFDAKGKIEKIEVTNLLAALLSFVLYKTESLTYKTKTNGEGEKINPVQLLGWDEKNRNFYGYKSEGDPEGNQNGTLFNALNLLFKSDPFVALMSESGLNIFKTINKKIAENENTYFIPLIDEKNFTITNIKHEHFDEMESDSKLTFNIKFTNPIFELIKQEEKVYRESEFNVTVIGPAPDEKGEPQPYRIETVKQLYKK